MPESDPESEEDTAPIESTTIENADVTIHTHPFAKLFVDIHL